MSNFLKNGFFIRHTDPDFHLRIRLLLSDPNNFGQLIKLIYKKLNRCNNIFLVWKIQLDTYNRELERYGKNMIDTESIFCADSKCILSIIKNLDGNENYRWMIALKFINELLINFCFTIEEKQKLMENMSKSFKTEFGFIDQNLKQFNFKFRENKRIIEIIMNDDFNDETKIFFTLSQSIERRAKELASIIEQIKNRSKDYEINQLLKSYIHMMMNRLFMSKNRLHELILYDFLFRYYTSEIAKKTK